MALRQDILRKIEKKQQEIRDWETKASEGRAYIQALQETLKLLSRDGSSEGDRVLRAGSSVAKARDVIKRAGRPLHVSDILKSLNRTNDKKNRLSLSGSLAHYVRRGEIFTRPEPNTFGLIELDEQAPSDDEAEPEDGRSLAESNNGR